MRFADLSDQNRRQVEVWARGHAWGQDAVMSDDGVLFGCVDPAKPETASGRQAAFAFASMPELARWAGYR